MAREERAGRGIPGHSGASASRRYHPPGKGPPLLSRRALLRSAAMEILLSVTIFVAFGAAFVFLNLLAGSLLRPKLPNPDKAAAYECGEPTLGSSWVQFDLRFYIVAL